jgi:hypothetical protein
VKVSRLVARERVAGSPMVPNTSFAGWGQFAMGGVRAHDVKAARAVGAFVW